MYIGDLALTRRLYISKCTGPVIQSFQGQCSSLAAVVVSLISPLLRLTVGSTGD